MELARRLSMDSMNASTHFQQGKKREGWMPPQQGDVVPRAYSIATRTRFSYQIPALIAFAYSLLLAPFVSRGSDSYKTNDSYNTIVHEHLALEATSPLDASPAGEDEAESPAVAELKRVVAERAESLPKGRRVALPPPVDEGGLLQAIALPAGAILVVAIVVYQLKRRFNALFPTTNRLEEYSKSVLVEDPSLAAYFHELRDGLHGAVGEAATTSTVEATKAASPAPIEGLFDSLPERLAKLGDLCLQVGLSNADNRQRVLADLLRQTIELKKKLQGSELQPASLLTCAVAGLLKQVSRSPDEVTESVTQTLSAAVKLLHSLCVRGLNPNLASEPPVRLLAVDDDAVSRLAVSFALRQAYDKPDLANDGESALAMIAQRTYDVIFLDVDMPNMDGFQLCKLIHQTESHRNTPVVFVTSHNDWKSRIMSRLSGGESHIAKPFLTFEITVKALTLVLRSRLGITDQVVATAPEAVPQATPVVSVAALPVGEPAEPIVASPIATPEPEEAVADLVENGVDKGLPQLTVSAHQDEFISSALMKGAGANSPQAFMTHAPAYVAALRSQLQLARGTGEQLDQQKFITRLLMGLRLLNSEAHRVERRMVSRMCTTLDRMLQKLLDQNQLCSPSMLNAAALALDLIEELSTRVGTELDLISKPISILVVDDDPVARRALAMAVQMAFGRPEQADSGEAALALAAEKPFDLIFLDVLMPGMDGFASCVKIHETPRNRQTPAVFVTGKNDSQSLSEATLAGGVGFISKPVVPTQITLTAMTFVLRNRLNASEPVHSN